MGTTGVIWDARYLNHLTGPWHPERPERLQAIRQVLDAREVGKKVTPLKPRLATLEEIALIHDFEYVRKIEKIAGLEVQLDPDTSTSPGTWDAARLAVGGLLNCVDWVMGEPFKTSQMQGAHEGPTEAYLEGTSQGGTERATQQMGGLGGSRNAFAFVRPPGHHAERARAMGFCLFNNIAIAAEYAIRTKDCRRVLIVDFDVHHGNGTQWAFYDRDDVFFISTHRYPFYPGTGSSRETGEGRGKGYTLNVTFPGGEGDHEYLKAFDDRILPTMRSYRPDLILVSAGFDAHRLDPLGGMNVTADGFGRMSEGILKIAREACGGRAIFVLEGGYSLEGLADSVEACLSQMLSI